MMNREKLDELISDLPKGPLTEYRNKAKFDWKILKCWINNPESIEYQNKIYQLIENDPLFYEANKSVPLEERRRLAYLRGRKLFQSLDLDLDLNKVNLALLVLGMYDFSVVGRIGLLIPFIISGLHGLGTERHMPYIQQLLRFEIGGCFCLTEISHGTDTKAMRTEARYEPTSQSFIFHTPDFEAAKCWSGNLGETASHAIVYAQLFTPDGICHGLHAFFIPIRNPKTMENLPGVTIIDMGEKLGLHGIDNGVVMFDHYAVPRETLLNKTGDVTPEGFYKTPFKDSKKRLGASLGNLSTGRVLIIEFAVINLRKALTIAVRYSAVRKQFSHNESEIPIIEYPLHQWRLFPYIAVTYALINLHTKFREHFFELMTGLMEKRDEVYLALLGQEVHALSCAAKPYSGWLARDGIQECREACGGHGYLLAAGFGHLRDDNDANLTYEGDNNVLLQQTSNWLIGLWSSNISGSAYPMGTVEFLDQKTQILSWNLKSSPFHSNLSNEGIVEVALKLYKWLTCWLCKRTFEELDRQVKLGEDTFTARNNTQVYLSRTLAIVYVEHVILTWFFDAIKEADKTLRPTFMCICALFSLVRLFTHIPYLYEGLLDDQLFLEQIRLHINRLCSEMLPDAVSLVDAFAPPDFFLQSVLGNADGKVYQHLMSSMMTAPGAMTKPKYWRELSYDLTPVSKL